jgi:hypothetical protein
MSIVGQLLLGWLLADFLTGVFHWWEDRLGKESWPVIGNYIIKPNRLHHSDPLAFARGTSFMDRNGASIIAALVIGGIWWGLFGLSILVVTTLVGGSISNEVHRYAHAPKEAGPVIKVLQEIGMWQSPKHHARHHRPPQDTNYFILTDWLNPIFEALDIWSRAERVLRK